MNDQSDMAFRLELGLPTAHQSFASKRKGIITTSSIIAHPFQPYFSFSLSSKQTQIAAIKLRSTPGAIVTKYYIAKSASMMITSTIVIPLTVCLDPKISLTFMKLL